MSVLSNNLIYLRGSSNLSQEAIAHKLKIHRSTYGTYETGKNKPSIDKLIKLSEIFKVSIEDLCKVKLRSKGLVSGGRQTCTTKTVSFLTHIPA